MDRQALNTYRKCRYSIVPQYSLHKSLDIRSRFRIDATSKWPYSFQYFIQAEALNFCNFLSAQISELGRLYYASAHSFLTGVANVENLHREFPRERGFSPPPRIPFSIFNRKTRLPLGISANNGAMERGLNYSAWPTALTTGSQTILVNHHPTVRLTFRARNLAA